MNRKDVVVVDLGAGNLRSVARALERAGAVPTITADPDAVLRAARVVVPGQGAFRDGARLKVPHMGWNEVRGTHRYLPERGWFYFVHSYYCDPVDTSQVVGTVQYGHPFCAAVARDNLFACQFHPEKSQGEGHALLSRFIEDTSWS